MMYAACRWRWIDGDVRPSLRERVQRQGPWDGRCTACGTEAAGFATWLWVEPGAGRATLMLDASRRGDLIDALKDHLSRIQARGEGVPAWFLRPETQFVERDEPSARREETTARRSIVEARAEASAEAQTEVRRDPSRPVPLTPESPAADRTVLAASRAAGPGLDVDEIDVPSPVSREAVPLEDEVTLPPDTTRATVGIPRSSDPDAGVPQLIGTDSPSPEVPTRPDSLGAYVADLTLDQDVSLRIRVPAGELPQWEEARLSARPVHLRGRGYPLVGVRMVGSYMGQLGCVDAVVDVGSTLATDAFRRLSERFEVVLVIEHGSRDVSRRVQAEGLEPNAALCIESARGLLARGEYPPQEFDKARRALEAEPAAHRLAPPEVTISSGAYQHIIGAREAVTALEHLERVSQKDTLARLLEVDGLPMAEYDAIRRRVLEGSLAHGLCAPRRFWRRLVASGLARDLEDYAQRLTANRSDHEGEEGDLEPEAAHEAWVAIHDLCRRKDIEPPPPLRKALDLPEPEVELTELEPEPELDRKPMRRNSASGEIRSGEIQSNTLPPVGDSSVPDPLGHRLRDPRQRLRAATEVLQGRARPEDLGQVINALEAFETSELLALLPDLSELGPRAVPGLIIKLHSERREVRQAATILLGMSRDPDALQRLSEHLVREPTTVWLDVARSLGWYGTAAIRSLCQVLRSEASTPGEQLAIDRVSRALAEVAVAQDSADGTTGRDAVRALSDAADPRVSTAARRAMASLAEVTTSGAQIRGEIPLREVTEIRDFSRRAYEAIMVPELEVEAEA